MQIIDDCTPKDWRQLRLRDISNIGSGTTPPRSMAEKYFAPTGTNWLKTTDLNNGEITSTGEMITAAAFEDCSIRVYAVNTIFVAMYGGFRQIGRTGIGKIPLTVNQAISAIEVTDSDVEPKYILHWLNSRIHGWRRFAASSRKDPNITRADVLAFPIALPQRYEQITICNIMAHWILAITLYSKLITAKKEFRRSLMQQLFSGKRRFPSFSDNWNMIPIDSVFKRVTRKTDDIIPEVLSITASVGFVSQKDKFSRVIAGKNLEKYTLLRKGEFSYNKGNSKSYPQGCIYRLKEYDEGAVPNVYYSFQASSEKVHEPFYEHYFSSGALNHPLSRLINTGVRNDGLLNLKADDFFSVKIPLPPIEEQTKIALLFDSLNIEINLLCRELDALKEQKKGLMHQLLTGKKRVEAPEAA